MRANTESREEQEQWPQSYAEAERDLILRTLESIKGNMILATELLGRARRVCSAS